MLPTANTKMINLKLRLILFVSIIATVIISCCANAALQQQQQKNPGKSSANTDKNNNMNKSSSNNNIMGPISPNSKCRNGKALSSYVKNLDLTKFSGTWYLATMTSMRALDDDNTTDLTSDQDMFNRYTACSQIFLDLSDARKFNMTMDIRLREAMNDSMIPPFEMPVMKVLNKNQELVLQPTMYAADLKKPNDGHWIAEVSYTFGTVSGDFYIIDTDYTSYAVWYMCTPSPDGNDDTSRLSTNWGLFTRQPKSLDEEKEISLTKAALAVGVPHTAFNDAFMDMPQDMCGKKY